MVVEDWRMGKVMGVLAGLALLAGGMVPAQAAPDGVWELETRDTRVQIALCGDGQQLCGALVWLSDASYNDRYRKLLNQPMMERVKQVAPNQWRGGMTLFGTAAQGTITQVSDDQLTLKGCVLLVVCKTYQLYRHGG